ncbi:hypothetical protein [Streptosporangium carneum]|nr:hypothetical protein [Streptosporangium carneum]
MRAVTWGPVNATASYTGGANGCGAGTWTGRAGRTANVPAESDSVRIT